MAIINFKKIKSGMISTTVAKTNHMTPGCLLVLTASSDPTLRKVKKITDLLLIAEQIYFAVLSVELFTY